MYSRKLLQARFPPSRPLASIRVVCSESAQLCTDARSSPAPSRVTFCTSAARGAVAIHWDTDSRVMTQRRRPILLPRTEFTVAAALAEGLTPGRLRGKDLTSPFWGVRMTNALSEEDATLPTEKRMLRAYATRMPTDAFFTHSSAAVVWEAPLPLGLTKSVHVGVLAPRRAPSGGGVRGHQLAPGFVRVVSHEGFRVTSPSSTWVQLGSMLSIRDLVATGDALVRRPRSADGTQLAPLTTIQALEAALAAGRRIGAEKLRAALGLIRVGASSRPESHLRLALGDAGLPDPDLDIDVFDIHGTRIGWTEIAYPQWKVLVEYEGDHHRTDVKQWNRDIVKHDRCREAGWTVVRITADHLYPDERLAVARVRAALEAAGWRPRAL